MALKLKDRPDGVYDDGDPQWRTNLQDDDLEDVRNLPEATDDDLPEGHPSRSKESTPEELSEAESNPDGKSEETVDEKESGFYKGGDDKQPLRQRVISGFTPKRVAAGGIAGIITIGVFGVLSISSGPLQFIHIAQLLQRFHFASQEDNSDSRMVKLYKWAKNAREGSVENSRLGVLEKKIAVKADERLSQIGIKKNYADTFGARFEGIAVNQEDFINGAKNGDEFRGLDKEEFTAKFKEKFNVQLIDAPDGSGLLIAPTEEIGGFFRNRSFNSVLVEEAGYSKITGAVTARIMGKRDAVTWHPIKKLDAKVVGAFDERFTAWLKQLKERIANGETPLDATAHGTRQQDGTTNPNPEGDQAAASLDDVAGKADEIIKDAEKTGQQTTGEISNGFIKQFTESTTGKVALGGTAAIGLVCAMKALGENIDNIRHDMVVLPLIRTGVQAMSLGNQVMNGKDMDAEQLGFFAKELNDPKSGSWASARSIQAELGQDPTGKDIPKSASIRDLNDRKFFDGVLGDIFESAPVGVVCDVADSIFGQVANIAIGVVTAPFATGIGFAIAQTDAAKDAIAGLVQWLAGSPIPTMVFGPDYGNYVNYGARLAANDSQLALGGVKLTGAQSAALKENRLAWQKQQFAQESFAERMFDPYSPDSLVGKAIDSQTGNVAVNTASMFNSILSPAKVIGAFGSIFSNRTHVAAASNYDYGFPEMGFSLDDLESSAYENPYENADKAIATLSGANGDSYISRAQKCFGVTLSKTGDVTSDFRTKIDPLKSDYPSDCTDPSPEWTSIRFYILDTKTAEAADCFGSGDTQSCSNVGFGNASSSPGTQVGSIVTGDLKTIAAQILANPNITYDPGIAARQQLQTLADGGTIDACGKGVDPALLGFIAALGQAHKVQISSLVRPGDGCDKSPHAHGCAVDIDFFDGQALTGSNDPSIALVNAALAIFPTTQRLGFGTGNVSPLVPTPDRPVEFFHDNPNHVHTDTRCHV